MVIYVDVLFIINFFITYLLLVVTAKFSKRKCQTVRLILASLLGGGYSLIILIDDMPQILVWLSKIVALGVILLVAFKFYRVSSFLKVGLIFLFTNMIFLGVIIGIYFAIKPNNISINNSIVYFNISAKNLLISAFVAYILSCLIVRIYNKTIAKSEVYQLIIENNAKEVSLYAFMDTGNKLREPFSDSPVIIVDRKKVQCLVDKSKIRVIPTSTINDNGIMVSFKPDKVTLKSSSKQEVIDNVYIALSDQLQGKSFSAIINPDILSC